MAYLRSSSNLALGSSTTPTPPRSISSLPSSRAPSLNEAPRSVAGSQASWDTVLARLDYITNKMDVLEGKFDTLDARFGTLTATVDTLTTNVDTLTTNVDALTTTVGALTTTVERNHDQAMFNHRQMDVTVKALSNMLHTEPGFTFNPIILSGEEEAQADVAADAAATTIATKPAEGRVGLKRVILNLGVARWDRLFGRRS